jgi:hypothetical protein
MPNIPDIPIDSASRAPAAPREDSSRREPAQTPVRSSKQAEETGPVPPVFPATMCGVRMRYLNRYIETLQTSDLESGR